MNDIYSRIDSLRRERGVTLAHLNFVMPDGYRGKLTEYKNGKTSLTDADISAIAETLDVSVEYIMTGAEIPNTHKYEDEQLLAAYEQADDNIKAAIRQLLKL